MRTLFFLFALMMLGGFFYACNEDPFTSEYEPVKMIPVEGEFTSTPTQEAFCNCVDPISGSVVNLPVFHQISGSAEPLGEVDPEKSPLKVVHCTFNRAENMVKAQLDMTIRNSLGMGIKLSGTSKMSFTDYSQGTYNVVDGYGLFKNSSGWFSTLGQVDFQNGMASFKVSGFVSEPVSNE